MEVYSCLQCDDWVKEKYRVSDERWSLLDSHGNLKYFCKREWENKIYMIGNYHITRSYVDTVMGACMTIVNVTFLDAENRYRTQI